MIAVQPILRDMVDAQDDKFVAVAEINAIDNHIWSSRHDPLKRAVNCAEVPQPGKDAQSPDDVRDLIEHPLSDDPPKAAVVWAAFFNFIAFLFFGLHVAQTIGTGIVDPAVVSPSVIFAALMGAVSWNVITWWAGIPSSSSHALIGGLLGAATAKAGSVAIVWTGVFKTTAAIFLSPLFGLVLTLALILTVS